MEFFINWLRTPEVNALFGIIGILLAIIGIIVGYIFYRKSLRVPDPCWSRKTNVLIKGYKATELPKLSIAYEGQPVEVISSTKILFWNRGKLGVRRDDISHDDPLQIVCAPNVDLLDVMQLQVNNQVNPLAVQKIDNKTALLTFNYLGKNDGGVVQVLHTGTSSNDINIVGTIMDADLRYVKQKSDAINFNSIMLLIMSSITAILAVLIALLSSYQLSVAQSQLSGTTTEDTNTISIALVTMTSF